MTLRRLDPAGFKTMPWRNGGGSTTELLIDPPGASLASGFRLRLSRATVGASGPFSSFPGVDRSLVLLAGGGMVLDHGAHGRQVLPGPLAPVAFPGEWATVGELLNGPCEDFNVMTDRARARHTLTVLTLGGAPAALPAEGEAWILQVRGAARLEPGGEHLAEGELVGFTGAPGRTLAGAEAVALLVTIT